MALAGAEEGGAGLGVGDVVPGPEVVGGFEPGGVVVPPEVPEPLLPEVPEPVPEGALTAAVAEAPPPQPASARTERTKAR